MSDANNSKPDGPDPRSGESEGDRVGIRPVGAKAVPKAPPAVNWDAPQAVDWDAPQEEREAPQVVKVFWDFVLSTTESAAPPVVEPPAPQVVESAPQVVETAGPQVLASAAPPVVESAAPEVMESAPAVIIESAPPQIIESVALEVVEFVAPQVIESAVPQVVESDPPEVIESAVPQVVESDPPEVMESAAPDVAAPQVESAPHGLDWEAPEVMESGPPEVIESAAPDVATPQVVKSAAPAVVDWDTPRGTDWDAPQVVESAAPQVMESAAPQVVESAAPQVVESAAPQVVESAAPQVVADSQQPEVALPASEPQKASDSVVHLGSIRDVQKGSLGQVFAKRPGRSVWLTGTGMPALSGQELGFLWTPKQSAPTEVLPSADPNTAVPNATMAAAVPNATMAAAVPDATMAAAVPNATMAVAVPDATVDAAVPDAAVDAAVHAILDAVVPHIDTNTQTSSVADGASAPVVSSVETTQPSTAVNTNEQAVETLTKAKFEFERGQFESALVHYEQALHLLDTSPQPNVEQICSCLKDLIDAYMFVGRPQDALAASRRLHDVDRARKKDKNDIIVLMKTAAACERSGNSAAAQEAFLEAIALAGELLPPEDPLRTRLNKAFAEVHKKQQKLSLFEIEKQAAERAIQQREMRARQTGDLTKLDHQSRVTALQWLDTHVLRSPVMQSVPVMVTLVGLFFVLVAGTVSSLHFERQGVSLTGALRTLVGQQFKSCDKQKVLTFTSASECKVSKHEHDSTAEYRSLTGGFADLKAIVSGWARNPTELWLQVTDAGLIDQDGTVLYKSDAPEFELSEKMWWYAQFAQSLYKGTKLYPINSTKYLSTPGFLYSNPFSGKSDHAEILLKRFAAADKTWTQSVKSGKKWDGEPVWRPGAIDCMCLDYCRFFIRGLDRNGQPLTSAEPGQTFAIELKDGVSSTQSEWKALAAAEASNRSAAPVHVFISASPGIQLFASTIRVMIPILLWVAFGLSVVFAIHMSKSGKFDIFIAALPICFLSMLALWYYYSLAAPW